MLSSFLVSLDDSESDAQILPYASALARSADVGLHLAHVHVPHPPTQLLTALPVIILSGRTSIPGCFMSISR